MLAALSFRSSVGNWASGLVHMIFGLAQYIFVFALKLVTISICACRFYVRVFCLFGVTFCSATD